MRIRIGGTFKGTCNLMKVENNHVYLRKLFFIIEAQYNNGKVVGGKTEEVNRVWVVKEHV